MLLLILAAVLVIAGFAGILLPALPGTPLIFAGLLLAAWVGLLIGAVAKVAIAFTMIGVFVAAYLIG